MEPRNGHIEREEVVRGGLAGVYIGQRRLEVEAEPLVVVKQGERDGSRAAGISGVVAETIEHEVGVLTFILSSTCRGKQCHKKQKWHYFRRPMSCSLSFLCRHNGLCFIVLLVR